MKSRRPLALALVAATVLAAPPSLAAQRAPTTAATSESSAPSVAWSVLGNAGYVYGSGDALVAAAPDGSAYLASNGPCVTLSVGGKRPECPPGRAPEDHDFWLAKVGSDGRVAWVRSLGGTGMEFLTGVALTSSGRVALVGTGDAPDFPCTAAAPGDCAPGGEGTGLLALLSAATGDVLVARTLGGHSPAWSVAARSDGGVAVAGSRLPDGVEATPGAHRAPPQPAGSWSPYIGTYDAGGRTRWVATLGATRRVSAREAEAGHADYTAARAVAVGADGDVTVTGEALTPHLPTTPGAVRRAAADPGEGYAARLTPTGRLAWATYLPGAVRDDVDEPTAVAVDRAGAVSVVTRTGPPGFAERHVRVVRLAPDGRALAWAVTLAGSAYPGPQAALSADGTLHVAGLAGVGFPFTQPANATYERLGRSEGFAVALAHDGRVRWAVPVGGSDQEDQGGGVALAPGGAVLVGGRTYSLDFPGASLAPADRGPMGATFLARLVP